ncbi:DUF1592 domain-containing protein [Lentisphaera profundi]|uniref:DUF1592 domain-containing protein n=1 Tax=Lentisphaera profundi TaxID=1658616 RepID=A0ABY7VPJ6_9BACT|nr:DUF1592 domain-containing protein [Lentisphaera profundi]WDE95644.1 DUF1592 domain-containing protein [Lentisphaera profundi]
MTVDSERQKCVFCKKELEWKNNKPHCSCGGSYFTVPLGTPEIKVSCPSCQRNLLLDREAFNHKLACSCDAYICVLEQTACPQESVPAASCDNDCSEEQKSAPQVGLATKSPEVKKSTKIKIDQVKTKKRKALRRSQKKSKVPMILGFIFCALVGAAYYLFLNSDNIKPEITLSTKLSEKVLVPEEAKGEVLDQVTKKEVEITEDISPKGRSLYQAKDLEESAISEIIKNFAKIDSGLEFNKLKVDLEDFSSLRGKHLPKEKTNLDILKISDYKNRVSPFFDKYCTECHGVKKQKGGMRLDTLAYALKTPGDVQHWQDVLDTLNGAQMPPKKSDQPEVKEMSGVIRSLSESLSTARLHFASQKGVATIRRLNRREYQRTMYELLGVEVDVEAIPEDNLYNGFDTVGEALSISPFQVRQYFKSAEEAVKKAMKMQSEEKRLPKVYSFELEDLLASRIDKEMKKIKKNIKRQQDIENDMKALPMKQVLAKYKQADEVALKNRLKGALRDGLHSPWNNYVDMEVTKKGGLLFPYSNGFNGNLQRFELDFSKQVPPGEYILRVHSALHKANVKSAYLKVAMGGRKTAVTLAAIPVFKSLEEGQVNEVLVKISDDKKGEKLILSVPFEMLVPVEGKKLNKRADKNHEGVDGIWIDRIEFIGPINRSKGEEVFMNEDENDLVQAEKKAGIILVNFAKKAFRGAQVSDAYVKRVMKVFREEFSTKKSMKEALVRPISTILSSGHFLYMVEESGEKRTWVNDRELAIRLSYFLWSSMPDEELMRLAQKGVLHRPTILKQQIDRMVENDKFQGFIGGFASQWFELEKVLEIAVNQNIYRSYNDAVKLSSIKESQLFINELFQKNLSLDNLIHSDFTLVDDSMAIFYGLAPKGESGFRLERFDKDSKRGGMLSHSSVLTMTSNGDRTSPVERGAYVLKKFLNRPQMLPPPNVPQLDIDLGKQIDTVRKSIAAHSALPQCASCHDLIDPLGFGMENFDTVGKWRTQEAVPGKKKKVTYSAIDSEGRLPDATPFDGFVEMRKGLMTQREDMLRGLIKAMLTYGLGRPVGFQDSQLVEDIFQYTIKNDYGARALLYAVATSDAFHLK